MSEIRNWWEIAQAEFSDDESWEDIASRMRNGYGVKASSSVISKVRSGARPLKTDFLEALAGTLDISPFRFGEYHLAIARELIDERRFGLEEALSNLDHLPALVAEASELTGGAVDVLRETEGQITRALEQQSDAPAGTGTEGQAARRKRGRA